MRLWTNCAGFAVVVGGVVLAISILAADATSGGARGERVPVSIHGVNHTAQEFTFVLADPLDKENVAGGETINAYGAGGTMCCFNLPKQWRPGLKAEVRATIWLEPTQENTLPSVKKRYVFDIPAYEQGKAAELWVLRTGDDELSVVLSDLQPDHPEWPGKIKGWPVPSLEYRRVIHARFLKEAQSDVELYERLLAGLKNRPLEHGAESWEFLTVNNAVRLQPFKGPTDTAFLSMLRADYQTGLVEAHQQLKRMKDAQP